MKINKNKNEKCFRFGECSIYYIYILITGLLFLLKNSLLCLKDIEIQKDFNLFGVDTVIKNHGLIKLILEFIGYIIYGAIFMLILKKIKNENTEKKLKKIMNWKMLKCIYTMALKIIFLFYDILTFNNIYFNKINFL